MDNLVLNFALIIVLLVGVIFTFVHISRKLRKGGGSLTTSMFGATDAFYHREKKNAIEVIIERKAGKKMKEQESEEPGPEENQNKTTH